MLRQILESLNFSNKKKTKQREREFSGNAFPVGLMDATHSGWFQKQHSLLYPGFTIEKNDVVVDVGCGDGGAINFCSKIGATTLYADLDSEKLSRKKKHLDNNGLTRHIGVNCDACNLPIADASANRIISMEVAEHLEDPQSFTQELFRICKPDGMLLISTPTQISEELQRGIAAPNYFESPNHIQIFNEERFREVVSNAGFLVKSYNLEGFYWSLGMLFFWNSGLALDQAIDPVRQHWANTWKSLLEAPNGKEIKNRLDQLLPKTQIIIAQKPS